ncbi:MAG: YdcF family protein [Bacteroidales bacterium]|nr:YdcF family protein [Bacteroidales bacterium]
MKFKLIETKECRVLNRKVKTVIALFLLIVFYLFIKNIHHFLSLNEPVYGQVLVLDGLLADYAIEQAVVEFNSNDNYKLIITSGGNIPSGVYVSKYKTMAELTKASLIKLGVNKNKIVAFPGKNAIRNRTYSSALTLNQWLKNHQDIKAIDVLTIGCHSRRSRLFYEKALNNKYKVGVISVPDRSYDTERWWMYSRGMRSVISETIGYVYAKFFFL